MPKTLPVGDIDLTLASLERLLEGVCPLGCYGDGGTGAMQAVSDRGGISLPVKDGRAAARQVLTDPGMAAIPISGLSAHAIKVDRRKARASGCEAYLTEPLSVELLLGMIERQPGEGYSP
jgi:CheY-like chemotaxis protein